MVSRQSQCELVRNKVVELIREMLVDDAVDVSGDDKLVDDLHLDREDLSLMFAYELEQYFAVKIPNSRWINVFTVDDAINLVVEFLDIKN